MMRVFKSNDKLIKVCPSLASIIGLNEAIVLHKFDDITRENNQHECFCKGNRLWIRHSVSDIKKLYFPFWSISTIKRILYSLDGTGLIKISSFNDGNLDTTNWYSINYDAVDRYANSVSLDTMRLNAKLVQSETTECEASLLEKSEELKLHKIATNMTCVVSEEELNEMLNYLD